MYSSQLQFARPLTWMASLATCVALIVAPLSAAQGPGAAGSAALAPSAADLEKLVGPIALYPDDLVAIILPASTNPLQLVQADRFLEKRKSDPKVPVDDRWDESVKSLVNYPEVVKQMSADLDWTTDLGEAVVADQGAVLGAVQAFRRKVQAAGNLKTDAKQVVVVEKEVIKIVPADPQVIYVPQYTPASVVVVSAAPVYAYYPSPYPVYYYPYPRGAALATGLVWGAAIGAAWGGNHYGTNWSGGNNNITINRTTNINTGNINTGNINRTTSAQNTAWKSEKKPGQVGTTGARPATTSARVGDVRPTGASGGAATRPSTQAAGGAGQGAATRSQAGAAQAGGAFGGYGSGSAARADSVLEYAQRLGSTPGKHDGLYWPADVAKGEEMSPFGPLVAESAAYLKGRNAGDPYRGYHFRILPRQGKSAPGGAYSYVINGRMIAGFAMVAYPDQYGESGVMTFIVNHNGRIFEKDLGRNSKAIAAKMTTFDPGTGWNEVALH